MPWVPEQAAVFPRHVLGDCTLHNGLNSIGLAPEAAGCRGGVHSIPQTRGYSYSYLLGESRRDAGNQLGELMVGTGGGDEMYRMSWGQC